jgi:Fe2+ or Zn2+ uptake regulation protein
MDTANKFAPVLRAHGFRVTNARVALLSLLDDAERPISPAELVRRIGEKANQATTYRSLETFADAGIVRRVNMEHQHAHYELVTDGSHHHHLICRTCGTVEDVDECPIEEHSPTLLKHSRKFRHLESHALEYFGLCITCEKKKHITH